MPKSHYSSDSASSQSSRSSHSSGSSSHSSRSSHYSSHEEIRSTRVALPHNRKALACIVWFAGGNPGLVKHIRRDDVVHPRNTKPRYHFVKVNATDLDYEEVDDYSSARRVRTRASSMPRGGGGGQRPPSGPGRRSDSAADYGGLPSWMGQQQAGLGGPGGPGGPVAPGVFPGHGVRMGPGGVPAGVRMANGMPVPMPSAQRFPPGAPGAPGPGGPGFHGRMPGQVPPGMRPGGPMPRGPGGPGGPSGPGRPGVNPIIVDG
ncbi:hypothetical protein SBRCBS47491_008418 [Sporothrix bragantina]|uniref:Uncharacterized protein n=1 Tax=Sporothrix bragantina TaxID=671064 RepID=A0ABP0CMT5_9PEZI